MPSVTSSTGPLTRYMVDNLSEMYLDYANQAFGDASSLIDTITSVLPTAYSVPVGIGQEQNISFESLHEVESAPELSTPLATTDNSLSYSNPIALDLTGFVDFTDTISEQVVNISTVEPESLNDVIAPILDEQQYPDAPSLAVPDAPVTSDITIPVAPETTIPEFVAEAPVISGIAAPNYAVVDNSTLYNSDLLTTLKEKLVESFDHGGWPVEAQTIAWDQARDREAAVAETDPQRVFTEFSRRGISMPSGVMLAALKDMQQDYARKLCDINRDIAKQQAELAEARYDNALQQTVAIESNYLQHYDNYWNRKLQASEATSQLAVQIYNTQVNLLQVEVSIFNAEVTKFNALIQAEFQRVEIYKAEVEAQKAVAEVDKTRADVYTAQVQALNVLSQAYQTQVQAIGVKLQEEGLKLQRFKNTYEAWRDKASSQLAIAQSFSAANQDKIGKVRAEADTFATRLQAYSQGNAQLLGSKASAFGAYTDLIKTKSDHILGDSRHKLERYSALVQKFGADVQAYSATVGERNEHDQNKLRRLEIDLNRKINNANNEVRVLEIDKDAYVAHTNNTLEAMATAANVQGQLAASSINAVNIGASIQASASSVEENIFDEEQNIEIGSGNYSGGGLTEYFNGGV